MLMMIALGLEAFTSMPPTIGTIRALLGTNAVKFFPLYVTWAEEMLNLSRLYSPAAIFTEEIVWPTLTVLRSSMEPPDFSKVQPLLFPASETWTSRLL